MANVEINDLTVKIPVDTDEFEGQATGGGASFKATRAELLANVAKTNVAQEFTATQNFNATTLLDDVNIAWDAAANQVSSVLLGGNRTLDNPTNMVDGATYILIVKQDTTASRTLVYGSAYKWAGGTAPTLTTTTNAIDIITFVCDGSSMYGVATLDFS